MKVCRTDTQHPVTQHDGASATKTLLAAIGVTIALATPALAQNARSIANEANQKWIQAYNRGDAAALTALYTKDAVLISPMTPEPVVGESSIRKYYDNDVQHRLTDMNITSTETKMFDPNTIIDAGTWGANIPGEKGAAPTHINGTYVVTFMHQGPDWLLRTDSANMMPPPPPK